MGPCVYGRSMCVLHGALWLALCIRVGTAGGEVRYSQLYPCFESLQVLHAGSAVGGRFTHIGNLYFLPGVRAGQSGLYVLSETISRFEPLERVPASKKENYLLQVEIISHREYAFVIRYEDASSKHSDPGWSIAHYTQDLKRPGKERRLVLLLSGRESTAADAIREEMRRSIPHLADRFEIERKNADLYPIVQRFAEEFHPAFDLSLRCARQVADGDLDLEIRFAVAHVDLLRALDRFDRDVARKQDETAWRADLEEILFESICQRLRCSEDRQHQDVRREARKLVEATAELHHLIGSVRTTHGQEWERPLLRNLLEAARVDSSSTERILERY